MIIRRGGWEVLLGFMGAISCMAAMPLQQYQQRTQKRMDTVADLGRYFPKSVDEITAYTTYAIETARKAQQAIIALPAESQTFANTMRVYDQALERFHRIIRIMLLYSMVMPDAALRKAAYKAYVQLTQANNGIWESGAMNQAIKSYVDHQMPHETLTEEEHYFIDEVMADYDRVGLNLSPDDQVALQPIKNDILRLKFTFKRNIAQAKRSIVATRAELAGVSSRLINTLEKQGDRYVVTTDYPTYYAVMHSCKIEKTRERLYLEFFNRAYPKNEKILEELLDLRNQLAVKLGAKDYATWVLQTETARTPAYVERFIKSLARRASNKELAECEALKGSLPEGVTLTSDGKIKPWDYGYVLAAYKKQHSNFVMRSVTPYFPLPAVLKGMFAVCGQFLGLSFVEVKPAWVWHPSVTLIRVSDDRTKALKGYIYLDLYPRDKKYSHAMHATLVVPMRDGKNSTSAGPSVAAIITNIPKSYDDKPPLLSLRAVKSLFHEFGHALHGLLSRPQFAYFAGTKVKRDFVEVPSQFFATWLTDPTILKKIGRHYRTNKPIPQEMVDRIIAARCWDAGYRTIRACWLSLISLHFHTDGLKQGLDVVAQSLHDEFIDSVAYDSRVHLQTSFSHLGSRGAKYYGYLWAQVMALDLFAVAQKEGLLNREAGQRFADTILRPGGSQDPVRLVTAYLGRKSKLGAFTRALALR